MKILEPYNAATEFFIEEGCFINELYNTGADDGLSIARARLEAGKSTRLHSLSKTIERYVILEGRGAVDIGDELSADVQAMDVVNIPAGVSQRITNTGTVDLIFLCICTPRFTPEVYNELDK